MRSLRFLLAALLLAPTLALAYESEIQQAVETSTSVRATATSTATSVSTTSTNVTPTAASTANAGQQIRVLLTGTMQQMKQLLGTRTMSARERRIAARTVWRTSHDSAMNIIRNMR
jgi:hypothetical protein